MCFINWLIGLDWPVILHTALWAGVFLVTLFIVYTAADVAGSSFRQSKEVIWTAATFAALIAFAAIAKRSFAGPLIAVLIVVLIFGVIALKKSWNQDSPLFGRVKRISGRLRGWISRGGSGIRKPFTKASQAISKGIARLNAQSRVITAVSTTLRCVWVLCTLLLPFAVLFVVINPELREPLCRAAEKFGISRRAVVTTLIVIALVLYFRTASKLRKLKKSRKEKKKKKK